MKLTWSELQLTNSRNQTKTTSKGKGANIKMKKSFTENSRKAAIEVNEQVNAIPEINKGQAVSKQQVILNSNFNNLY